jgi:hypothetical protein
LEISWRFPAAAIARGYCAEGLWPLDFPVARRLVISRAQSINSFATGLRVRSFKVTIATGLAGLKSESVMWSEIVQRGKLAIE